ncbi:caspase family protein [Variovorax sp. KK3]|uniref:caspase family protein n=1 Tax=Variovorax sp. KK3 TaxID=1855728 RepID=UPI00097BD5AD|nr:caspase family protein [Variovorax sp. KK3]
MIAAAAVSPRIRAFALAQVALWLLVLLAGAGAWAQQPGTAKERRIALVIGNARYPSIPLDNPENDARLMASNLKRLGFEVNEQLNLDMRDMRRVLRDFARKLQEANVVSVLYYAGHGVQIDGRNYLLPVDINLRDQEEVKDDAVDIEDLFLSRVDRIRGGARIVILDACRDNPFAGRTRNIRSAGGLAEMAARGTLIAFASAPGAPAEDGPSGRNSVYTRHLADEMMTPGLEVEQMFKNVRVKVLRDTRDRQTPWINTSLTSNFSFNPAMAGPSAAELALQERVRVLESQLAKERQVLASAGGQAPVQAQPPLQPPLQLQPPANVAVTTASPDPPAAPRAEAPGTNRPTDAARIGQLQAELESTRQDLATLNAPSAASIQDAAREALANRVERPPVRDRSLLRRAELEQMFLGKNVTFVVLGTGDTFRWYFRGDGNVFFKNQTKGNVGYGAWKVNDNGAVCIQWATARANDPSCTYYFSESGKVVRTNSPDPTTPVNALIVDVR